MLNFYTLLYQKITCCAANTMPTWERKKRIKMMSFLLLLDLTPFRKKNIFQGILELLIYNDGGPHHFKISSAVLLMLFLEIFLKLPLTYNFFPSYHGHNACDAAASIIKKRLNTFSRDYEIIREQEEIAGVIRGLISTPR